MVIGYLSVCETHHKGKLNAEALEIQNEPKFIIHVISNLSNFVTADLSAPSFTVRRSFMLLHL